MSSSDTSTVEVDTTTTTGTFTVTARFTTTPGVTALFGPSGSGKSVTLATIAGILRPLRGTVVLHGRTVADAERGVHVRTQDRGIGMVFQHAALLPHRSPLDNVAIAVNSSSTRAERRAVAGGLLDHVHAAHLADRPTTTLSGGEQQRVALARAIAGDPTTLLLDEPFSALDLPTRRALRQLVRDLVDEHSLTAILVTHDLEDITDLADRVVLYEPGTATTTHELDDHRGDRLTRLLGLM